MNELTRAQEEYFKDSKLRNKDGELITCFHCTEHEFNKFDKNYIGGHNSFYGKGFYFSGDDKYDQTFGEQYKGSFGHIQHECYIDMKNPLVLGDLDLFEIIDIMEYMRDNHPGYGIDKDLPLIATDFKEYPTTEEEYKLIPESFTEEIFRMGAWAKYGAQLTEYAKENGYDGIIDTLPQAGIVREIVVFEPNQIKLTSNIYPTKDDNFKDNSQEYMKENFNKLGIKEQVDLASYINKKLKEEDREKRDKYKDKNRNKEEKDDR